MFHALSLLLCTSGRRWMLLFAAAAFFVAGCDNAEPTPIKVFVTATTSSQISSNVTPAPSIEGTQTLGGLVPTQVSLTPTPSPTITYTPSPIVAPPTPAQPSPATPTNAPVAVAFSNVPSAEQLPTLDMRRFGIQLHPYKTLDEWRALLGHADRLDFKWIKVQLDWSFLEPLPGQFSDVFYAYAQRVQAANIGLEPHFVMLSIAKAPDWARPAGFNPQMDGPPANPADLANFITAFIREVKPQDNRIHAIEIWNEPNLRREWDGAMMDGATYMTYFRAAYDAIKAIAPNIVVLTAGLAPVCGVPDTACDRDFLQQMYDSGLKNYLDVKIGAHPYGWANPPASRCCTTERGWADNRVFYFMDTLEDYRAIMQRNNDPQRKIWITEFGWGTFRGVGYNGADVTNVPPGAEFFNLISSEQQAQYVVQAMDLIQQPPLSEFVEVAILWNMNFALVIDPTQTFTEQAGYSLLDAGGNPRLVYYYLLTTRKILG